MTASMRALAGPFAQTALRNIATLWPQRLDGLLEGPGRVPEPRLQHPVFHGAYDWHSCVHMHWLLARLLRLFPGESWNDEAVACLDSRLRPESVLMEREFILQPANRSFERPYGWAWVFKLDAGLRDLSGMLPPAREWADALSPLTLTLREHYIDYLARLPFPIRAGTHSNTAFSMLLALDLAQCAEDVRLSGVVRDKAIRWFGADRAYPASYEPDGEDFLSGGLVEAALMSRILQRHEFEDWWQRFKPDHVGWQAWSTPVTDIDRTDARLVHLDGLNLSRAWCFGLLASALPKDSGGFEDSRDRHLAVSLPNAVGGDYVGEHWLPSFATLALAN